MLIQGCVIKQIAAFDIASQGMFLILMLNVFGRYVFLYVLFMDLDLIRICMRKCIFLATCCTTCCTVVNIRKRQKCCGNIYLSNTWMHVCVILNFAVSRRCVFYFTPTCMFCFVNYACLVLNYCLKILIFVCLYECMSDENPSLLVCVNQCATVNDSCNQTKMDNTYMCRECGQSK